MATEHDKRIHEALGKDGEAKEKGPAHTHSAHYERADNGGIYARIEKRHKDGSHAGTEHHVLMGKKEAAAHLLEHMADQPDVAAQPEGEEAPPDDQAAAQQPQAEAGPPPGAAAPPPMAGM